MKVLPYSIYKYSSYSSIYIPENIKISCSNDQSSRWSSDSNNPPQYLIIKLNKPAIVQNIKFGKYEQTHVCNLKKFKVLGGMEESCMIELLESGLKNDNVDETFTLKHTIDNAMFPIRYIQIVPVLSWGPSFNFSIWFVELCGLDDDNLVAEGIKHFNSYREKEVIRLCMKHLRQHNYPNALKALQQETGFLLEDPFLSELYEMLVDRIDFDGAEKFIEDAIQKGYFQEYIQRHGYQPEWQKISQCQQAKPGMRGGHQMSIDPFTNTLYLFGGWDGSQDLNDLWSYSLDAHAWSLLCDNAEAEGGPCPRSCHKMCLDTDRKQLFMLGRYLDTQYRLQGDKLKGDFYMYDITANKWVQICEDTAVMGGPQLLFDHQICFDVQERVLYVFGGRVLTSPVTADDAQPLTDPVYSGLYAYHVSTNTWRQLLVDISQPNPSAPTIQSRIGHSMLFHTVYRKLYMFAGIRTKEYINDMFTYDVDTHTTHTIYSCAHSAAASGGAAGASGAEFPSPGFTQRSTIDPCKDEIYVLSGLSKEKDKRQSNVHNSLWVYRIKEQKWTCIYQNSDGCGDGSSAGGAATATAAAAKDWKKLEPCPRFAHQLVYDQVRCVHYLFGGNSGGLVQNKLRLDDFWMLRLNKPSAAALLHKCRLSIRTHRYRELAVTDSVAALVYLRTKLAELIDHNDKKQTEEFHNLPSALFQNDGEETCKSLHYCRNRLFEQLTQYFPTNLVQPQQNLSDLIQL